MPMQSLQCPIPALISLGLNIGLYRPNGGYASTIIGELELARFFKFINIAHFSRPNFGGSGSHIGWKYW